MDIHPAQLDAAEISWHIVCVPMSPLLWTAFALDGVKEGEGRGADGVAELADSLADAHRLHHATRAALVQCTDPVASYHGHDRPDLADTCGVASKLRTIVPAIRFIRHEQRTFQANVRSVAKLLRSERNAQSIRG